MCVRELSDVGTCERDVNAASDSCNTVFYFGLVYFMLFMMLKFPTWGYLLLNFEINKDKYKDVQKTAK